MKISSIVPSLACLVTGCTTQPTIHPGTDPVAPCYEFDKGQVAIRGTIFTRIYFGPPNYGEQPATDRREEQALLLLDAPICVRDTRVPSTQNEFNVIVVQIAAINVTSKKIYRAVGKRVAIDGELFHSETGHHRTPVLIAANDVKILD